MGSVSFEQKGGAASGLLSPTNPASHKACRSALKALPVKVGEPFLAVTAWAAWLPAQPSSAPRLTAGASESFIFERPYKETPRVEGGA
jgi:hypothetical protein